MASGGSGQPRKGRDGGRGRAPHRTAGPQTTRACLFLQLPKQTITNSLRGRCNAPGSTISPPDASTHSPKRRLHGLGGAVAAPGPNLTFAA